MYLTPFFILYRSHDLSLLLILHRITITGLVVFLYQESFKSFTEYWIRKLPWRLKVNIFCYQVGRRAFHEICPAQTSFKCLLFSYAKKNLSRDCKMPHLNITGSVRQCRFRRIDLSCGGSAIKGSTNSSTIGKTCLAKLPSTSGYTAS